MPLENLTAVRPANEVASPISPLGDIDDDAMKQGANMFNLSSNKPKMLALNFRIPLQTRRPAGPLAFIAVTHAQKYKNKRTSKLRGVI